jgi:hypothetical protein
MQLLSPQQLTIRGPNIWDSSEESLGFERQDYPRSIASELQESICVQHSTQHAITLSEDNWLTITSGVIVMRHAYLPVSNSLLIASKHITIVGVNMRNYNKIVILFGLKKWLFDVDHFQRMLLMLI